MDTPKKILICHSATTAAEARRLGQALESVGHTVRTFAVDSNAQNRDKLSKAIGWADVVLFLLDEELNSAPMAGLGGDLAMGLGKTVIGTWCDNDMSQTLPGFLANYADAVTDLDLNSIIDAISGEEDKTHLPSGDVRPPRELKRYTCR